MKLFPSILSADFACLKQDLDPLVDVVDQLHLDVMDGHFVPNISFGPPVVEAVSNQYENFQWDAHLMISKPEDYVDEFVKLGMDWISVHAEVDPDLNYLSGELRGTGTKLGLAFNPSTPVSELVPHLNQIDYVVAMTVQPGFSGQSFREDVLDKIKRLRKQFEGPIQVDGGIGEETIERASDAGADWFVSGSSVFGQSNPASAASRLQTMVH
jgi:ribulose-phosphate 3-epimerase